MLPNFWIGLIIKVTTATYLNVVGNISTTTANMTLDIILTVATETEDKATTAAVFLEKDIPIVVAPEISAEVTKN